MYRMLTFEQYCRQTIGYKKVADWGRLEAMKGRKMPGNNAKPTRPRGRPAVRVMPDPIPDTPENVVRALCQGPPKPTDQWEFMNPGGAGYTRNPNPTQSS